MVAYPGRPSGRCQVRTRQTFILTRHSTRAGASYFAHTPAARGARTPYGARGCSRHRRGQASVAHPRSRDPSRPAATTRSRVRPPKKSATLVHTTNLGEVGTADEVAEVGTVTTVGRSAGDRIFQEFESGIFEEFQMPEEGSSQPPTREWRRMSEWSTCLRGTGRGTQRWQRPTRVPGK